MGHLGSRRVAQALIAACVGYFHSASGASYQYLGPRLPTDPVRGPCAARAAPLRARSVWTSGKASALLGAIADFSLLPLGSTTALMRRGYDDGVSLGECKPHGTSHHIRINRIPRAGPGCRGRPGSASSRRVTAAAAAPAQAPAAEQPVAAAPADAVATSGAGDPGLEQPETSAVSVAPADPPRRRRRVVAASAALRRSRPLSSTWPVTRSASPMSQRMLS